jgi:hypothetical protein
LERNGTERWSFLSFPFLSSEATGQSTDKSGFSSGYACYAAAASDGDLFIYFFSFVPGRLIYLFS